MPRFCEDCGSAVCQRCGECTLENCCCDDARDDALYDADELGLDPEDDDDE